MSLAPRLASGGLPVLFLSLCLLIPFFYTLSLFSSVPVFLLSRLAIFKLYLRKDCLGASYGP